MRAIAAVLLLGLAPFVTPTFAQGAGENDKGRFTFKEVPDGILRLDGRTGHVSLCSRVTEWACRTLADDRVALENEIGRLFDENVTLRKQLEEARRAPVPPETVPPSTATPSPVTPTIPPPAAAPTPKQGERELTLPSDADLNRMMTFLEKMWRRLLDMAQRTQRELEQDRPGAHKNGT
jgi:hypothetical protein